MKFLRKSLFLFLVFWTITSPTKSIAQVLVEGAIDCGVWIETRITRKSVALEHYVLGQINGMSLGSGVSIWGYPKSNISRDQAFFWFDKFCRDNPLKDITLGTVRFADEMTEGRYTRALKSR